MFKVAGVSRCKGVFKVRFANDMDRVKTLIKTGHDEIELMNLPEVMDKPAVVTFLKGTALMERAEYAAAITAADAKYNGSVAPKAPKAPKTVRVAGVKVKAPRAKTKAESTPAAESAPKGNWFEEQFADEIAAAESADQE